MIKLSRLACYGVVILTEMAEGEKLRTASDISLATRLPEPTVAKVLKLLAKNGFVSSSRGINGGYSMDRLPDDISVAEIIEAMDGDISLTGCVDGRSEDCRLKGGCSLIGCWDTLNAAVRQAFTGAKLSGIIAEKNLRRGG